MADTMTITPIHAPTHAGDEGDAEPHRPAIRQAAALCLRGTPRDDGLEVLLIARRGAGEWWIPKDHIEQGERSHQTARREAFEEAGVVGEPDQSILDFFRYRKPGAGSRLLRGRPSAAGVARGRRLSRAWRQPDALDAASPGQPPDRQPPSGGHHRHGLPLFRAQGAVGPFGARPPGARAG